MPKLNVADERLSPRCNECSHCGPRPPYQSVRKWLFADGLTRLIFIALILAVDVGFFWGLYKFLIFFEGIHGA